MALKAQAGAEGMSVDRRFNLQLPVLQIALAASLISTTTLAADQPPAARVEQRIEFFKAGSARVATERASDTARADVPPRGETIALQRFQLGDVDPLKAAPGDRIIIAVNGGESFELVLYRVAEAPGGVSVFWRGRLPSDPYSQISLEFVRESADQKPKFAGGKFELSGPLRQFTLNAVPGSPGLVEVREIKAGTAVIDLSNDQIDVWKPGTADTDAKLKNR